MAQEKTYLGKGKVAGSYGIVNFSVCLTDIPREEIYEYNGKKYINLSIGQMKQADKFGKTHNVWLNDYKPEKKDTAQAEPPQANGDDLPF